MKLSLNKFKNSTDRLKSWFQRSHSFLDKNKYLKKYFLISLIVPVGIIISLTIILPLFYLHRNLKTAVQSITATDEILIPAIQANDSLDHQLGKQMFDLRIEELFLQSQIQMAKSDSIGLAIDLWDSTVSLQIRGVKVRECKIYRLRMTQTFKHLKVDRSVLSWLSKPFTVQTEWATIPKVPVKIRKAPKDSIEASLIKSQPISIERPDIYYTMELDRNLLIEINQVESPSLGGRIQRTYYNLKLNLKVITNTIQSLVHLQSPQNPFWIELYLTRNDIKAIYRALPPDAIVALRL